MLFCMRTTLDIDDRLMRLVKKQAVESGQTITGVIENALREALVRQKEVRSKPFKLRWRTVRGRLRPGVDLTDRDVLYERMEGRS
jgi:hypothetical protein